MGEETEHDVRARFEAAGRQMAETHAKAVRQTRVVRVAGLASRALLAVAVVARVVASL